MTELEQTNKPVSGVTGVGPYEQVVLVIVDKVHTTKIAWNFSVIINSRMGRLNHLTCLVNGIKTKMTFLRFARVTRGSHYNPLHIAQSALIVAVIRI